MVRAATTIPAAVLLLGTLSLLISQTTASGYDSSGSCNPRPSRRGRAQLLAAIPCDLTVQAYCNLPGTAYPWNAVRRFVHENQGLMKRMYGDTRHISVLKTEFEQNEIDVDDIQIAMDRYSPKGKRREERKTKYSGHASRLNDVLVEPHFRPAATTTTTTTSTTTTSTTSTTTTATSTESGLKESSSNSSTESPENSTERKKNPFGGAQEPSSTMSYMAMVDNLKEKYKTILEETNSVLENTTEEGEREPIDQISYNQEKIPDSAPPSSSTERVDSREKVQISSTLKIVKQGQDGFETTTLKVKANSTDDIADLEIMDNRRDEVIFEENGSSGGISENPPSRSQIRLRTTTEKTASSDNSSPLDRVDNNFSDESSEIYGDSVDDAGNSFDDNSKRTTLSQGTLTQQQQPQQTQSQTMMDEGHLYQDSVQKNNNNQQPVVVTGRGVNACPVKEEVVAPFWANNTRGEVLALLNLYPFEQYVHWEKCTQEHKQMYCREGCRCEQQYRLHRLLAYDPHNECRGIFSDWFRFPSCCICKCYDIPSEFRVTSRSPRSPRETSAAPTSFGTVEEAQQNLHEAIYAHATEDWYHRGKRDAAAAAKESDNNNEWSEIELEDEEYDDEHLLDLVH